MAKKFNTQDITEKFFTQPTQETQNTQNKQDKPDINHTAETAPRKGRPPKEKPLRGYRYGLLLDDDLDAFLHEIVWVKRTSMTQYVNDIIREKKEEYVKECLEKGVNPYEGWEKENERKYK